MSSHAAHDMDIVWVRRQVCQFYNKDRIKLDPTYNPPEVEVKTVKLICDCIPVPLRGILKKPGSRLSIHKNVSFDATFHTARIVAKQSIKEWKQEST